MQNGRGLHHVQNQTVNTVPHGNSPISGILFMKSFFSAAHIPSMMYFYVLKLCHVKCGCRRVDTIVFASSASPD